MPINTINGHSSLQHAFNKTDVTFIRRIMEAVNDIIINFYGRNSYIKTVWRLPNTLSLRSISHFSSNVDATQNKTVFGGNKPASYQ